MARWATLLVLVVATAAGASSTSEEQEGNELGYYHDGAGEMSPRDQTRFLDRFLSLLGFASAPATEDGVRRVRLREAVSNRTRSRFMRDVYRAQTLEEGADGAESGGEAREQVDVGMLERNQFGITEDEIETIVKSDVIMSFANHRTAHDLKWSQPMWFNTSTLPSPQDETVLDAELRLYKGRSADWFPPGERVLVRCSQVVDKEDPVEFWTTLRFRERGWVKINVTGALKDWQLDYGTNLGLQVEMFRARGRTPLRFADAGFSGSADPDSPNEAFLVGYFKATPENPLSDPEQHLRLKSSGIIVVDDEDGDGDGDEENEADLMEDMEARERRHASTEESDQRTQRTLSRQERRRQRDYMAWEAEDQKDRAHRSRGSPCVRRPFPVRFNDVGFGDAIIDPKSYQAFYCLGECSFPLNSGLNVTNHAVMQALMHLHYPHLYPGPKCAPTAYTGLNLLYFDDSFNVGMKKYSNMVVKSCGCH